MSPNTWPDVLSLVGENLRFEDKHLLRRAEPQTRIATTASSANQLTSKMTIALGIKLFFMAISRNFGLALAFMGLVCQNGTRFSVTAITCCANVIALENA